MDVNWMAAVAAAVAAFVLGGAWYSPALFGSAWMRASGITPERAATANMAKVFGVAFVWTLLLINGGYHTAQYTLYGLILGLWH